MYMQDMELKCASNKQNHIKENWFQKSDLIVTLFWSIPISQKTDAWKDGWKRKQPEKHEVDTKVHTPLLILQFFFYWKQKNIFHL